MTINQSAQEMVNAIAQIVSGRTINIMDKNAIIIASSDPDRIGTFHQGAAEVLASGKPVSIQKDALPRYEGAKEGVNLPIVLDGKLFGVVGIYGIPDEVQDAANLLCVYVRQYFAQMALNRKEHMENELRAQLLKLLVLDFKGRTEEIQQISALLGIKIRMPMRAVVVSIGENDSDPLKRLKSLDKLPNLLMSSALINPKVDLYGVVNDCFVLLKHTKVLTNADAYIRQIREASAAGLSLSVTAAIGENCDSTEQLRLSYREALTLVQNGQGCFCMDSRRTQLDYLFCRLQKTDELHFPRMMYAQLEESFGAREVDWVMQTIQTYYDCCGSIGKAAAILHIHKNTMLYRMNRICSALKLDTEDDFTKKCFLKLLLVNYHRLKG